MAQSASSKPNDRLAARMSKSPPGGIAAGVVAILVMVLALVGVLPQLMFFVGAAGLVGVAYVLDKRFKAVVREQSPGEEFAAPPASAPIASAPAAPPPTLASTPVTAATAPPPSPVAPSPSLLPAGDLPAGDLRAEHTRLTQELTDRVDDDEDVRFEKFMQLRKIEAEIERQQGAPPQ
jgi:hypothetical protein